MQEPLTDADGQTNCVVGEQLGYAATAGRALEEIPVKIMIVMIRETGKYKKTVSMMHFYNFFKKVSKNHYQIYYFVL